MKRLVFMLSAAALLTAGIFACSKEQNMEKNLTTTENLEVKRGKSSQSLLNQSGAFHNSALDYLFENQNFNSKTFEGVDTREDFYAIYDESIIYHYNIHAKNTIFETPYIKLPDNIKNIRNKHADIYIGSVDVEKVKQNLLNLREDVVDSEIIVSSFYSKTDYDLVIELFDDALEFLETNNEQKFFRDVNILAGKWNQFDAKSSKELEGVFSGVTIGVAKSSFLYWQNNKNDFDLDEDIPNAIPWVVVWDLVGVAESLLEDAATTAATGESPSNSEIIFNAVLSGAVSSVGGKYIKAAKKWLGL